MTRLGVRPEIARTRFHLAHLLFEHFPDEKETATAHLNYAVQEFGAMKMKHLLEEAMRLKLEHQGLTSTDINTSIDMVARNVQAEKPDLRSHAEGTRDRARASLTSAAARPALRAQRRAVRSA